MKVAYKAMLIISCSSILLFLLHNSINWTTHPLRITYAYDLLFPFETEEKIQKILSNASSDTPIHTLLAELQKNVPNADSLSRRLFADGTIAYTITSEKPHVLINEDLVFTCQGTIRPASFFKQNRLINIASCSVMHPELLEKDEIKAFEAFASLSLKSLITKYRVIWQDKTDLLLQTKDTHLGNLIITSWQPIDAHFIKKSRSAEQLLLGYKEKGMPRRADLRYRDFIIISA